MNWQEHREKLLGEEVLELPPNFKLPMLPQAVLDFNEASKDPHADAGKLAKILETDSGLTVEILRLVNSSVYGFRSQINSVKQAISMLGVSRTKTSVLTMAVEKSMAGCKSKLINLKHFWAANMERAFFAKEIAVLLKADQEIAYSASMLQDFILPVLTSAMFDQYTEFIDRGKNNRELLTVFEQKKFAWDHAVAAAHITKQWGFPDEIVCCLYLHHQGLSTLMNPEYAQTPIAAVALSGLLPDVMQQTPGGLDQLQQLEAIWKSFDLYEVATLVEEQFSEMGGDQVHHLTLKRRLDKIRAQKESEVLAE